MRSLSHFSNATVSRILISAISLPDSIAAGALLIHSLLVP